MRIDLLLAAEEIFYERYPGGFLNPEMEAIKKKHKADKMHELTIELFAESKSCDAVETVENMVSVITKSSLVSVFEKIKFRDFARSLSMENKAMLTDGITALIHGNHEEGFNIMIDVLLEGKLAKWPLMTIIPYYFHPQTEVFVKPTTTKGIIKTFELEGLVYKPLPSYEFYLAYKSRLFEMREIVSPNLSPDNAAFAGFLMIMMDSL